MPPLTDVIFVLGAVLVGVGTSTMLIITHFK